MGLQCAEQNVGNLKKCSECVCVCVFVHCVYLLAPAEILLCHRCRGAGVILLLAGATMCHLRWSADASVLCYGAQARLSPVLQTAV